MPISVIPKFLQKAFAATGAKTNIPLNADLINGRAGYNEGFPPINMTAVAAGGIPPYGQDMNGVLYDLSTAIQYIQSGIDFPFDSAFATAIGGYAVGAIVSDASDKSLLWVNGTASNTTFPTGWTSFKYSDPTETVRGLSLVATQAEVDAGADDKKAVTPKKLRAGFSASFVASSGYLTLPTWLGGLVFQWGNVVYTGTSGSAISFPLAFPSACYGVFTNPSESSNEYAISQAVGLSKTGFSAVIYTAPPGNAPQANTSVAVTLYWFALGK